MREWIMGIALKAYEVTLPFYDFALVATLLVILPLAIWRRTRGAAAAALLVASYIFGLTTWLLGAAVTFGSFGWFGLIMGLLVFGVGVVPLAIIGSIFKLDNGGLAVMLFVMVVVTLAARFGAIYTEARAEKPTVSSS